MTFFRISNFSSFTHSGISSVVSNDLVYTNLETGHASLDTNNTKINGRVDGVEKATNDIQSTHVFGPFFGRNFDVSHASNFELHYRHTVSNSS